MISWHVFTVTLLFTFNNAFGDYNVVVDRNIGIPKPIEQQWRELTHSCQGPDGINYFEIAIRVIPDNVSEICSIADQIFLGNDLNQLLNTYGLDDTREEEEDSNEFEIFVAGLCPLPSTTLRRSLAMGALSFSWVGQGGCRYCQKDSLDSRRLRGTATGVQIRTLQDSQPQDTDWFNNVYAPEKEATILAAIVKEVLPKHTECLGRSPTIEFTLTKIALAEMNFLCDDGTLIESLSSVNFADVPLLQHDCGECKSIDFSQSGNNTDLRKGDYVQDEWKLQDGLTIFASGGYAPNFKARILNTSDVECMSIDGTRDFGSPNIDCENGGTGEGSGGIIGRSGENCRPVGNVLIIQDSNKSCPDASRRGGSLKFIWDKPVMVSDIGLMDIDEKYQRLKFTYADGFMETFTYEGFGDNAVQRVIANKMNVVELKIVFTGTGAVTQINFCHTCDLADDPTEHDVDHHCLYDNDGTLINPELVIANDDFEEASSFVGWSNARQDDLEQVAFTKFLGRYAKDMEAPFKTFDVPRDARKISIKIDFYEIDGWENLQDRASILIDDHIVELGFFDSAIDEGHREGVTDVGIAWSLDSVTTPSYLGYLSRKMDQKHRIDIRVSKETGLYDHGKLRLTLKTLNSANKDDESGGWDNVQLIAAYGCEHQENAVASVALPSDWCINEEYSEDFENDKPLSGWSNGKLETEGAIGFTKFLGRYGNGDASPEKEFIVPSTAEEITIEVDFYEIDSWDGVSDTAVIFIDDEKIDMGIFAQWEDEDHRSGTSSHGILWQLSSITRPIHLGFMSSSLDLDQKHHVVITIPKASGLFDDGKIVVKLEVILSRTSLAESGGWDNLKISSKGECTESNSTSVKTDSEPVIDSSVDHLTVAATASTGDTLSQVTAIGSIDALAETTTSSSHRSSTVVADVNNNLADAYTNISEAVTNTTAVTSVENISVSATVEGVNNLSPVPITVPTPTPTHAPTHAPTHIPTHAPTHVPTTVAPTTVRPTTVRPTSAAPTIPLCVATPWTALLAEDFEGRNALSGWSNGKLETGGTQHFTKFLGRYFQKDASPYKNFTVGRTSTTQQLLFEVDFYEIDSWNGGSDSAAVYLGDEKIDLGSFSAMQDEGSRTGSTPRGLTWNLSSLTRDGYLGFSMFDRDQKHHVAIEIPKTSNLFQTGYLEVKLEVHLSSSFSFFNKIETESGGWDNLKISSKKNCLP